MKGVSGCVRKDLIVEGIELPEELASHLAD
jgi:hypothetical protein